MTQEILYTLILLLGLAAYGSMVWQMLAGQYSPSFFSRGVWFLLGINSFAGVLLTDGSTASAILAGTLFAGNGAVFITSYWKGSRDFHFPEKISLALLIVSGSLWALLDAPFISLVLSLAAHFIGGIPTIWRAEKRPVSEQAYHWYLFLAASVLSVLASDGSTLKAIVFPVYFIFFESLILILVNRKLILKMKARTNSY